MHGREIQMMYGKIKELEIFVDEVNEYLFNIENHTQVEYPASAILPWNSDSLVNTNEKLLSSVSGAANVYAIFTASKNSENYSLRYIGKTTRKLARQRLRNHLFKKHEKTGAKLSNIIAHIHTGGKVRVSWAQIEPESLRNYIEEEIIAKNTKADWNRENT